MVETAFIVEAKLHQYYLCMLTVILCNLLKQTGMVTVFPMYPVLLLVTRTHLKGSTHSQVKFLFFYFSRSGSLCFKLPFPPLSFHVILISPLFVIPLLPFNSWWLYHLPSPILLTLGSNRKLITPTPQRQRTISSHANHSLLFTTSWKCNLSLSL